MKNIIILISYKIVDLMRIMRVKLVHKWYNSIIFKGRTIRRYFKELRIMNNENQKTETTVVKRYFVEQKM